MQVKKPNHKRRTPKQGERGKFSELTRKIIVERDQGLCQSCGMQGQEIHHVQFKSAGGRGVATNGVVLCHICHSDVHRSRKIADYWRDLFSQRYGPDYYKDEFDL